MATSLFHEIRVLYRTTANTQIHEFTHLHGCEDGDALLKLNRECQSAQPFLHLIVEGCSFTARKCIIDNHPSVPDDNKAMAMYHYQLDYHTHKAGLITVTDAFNVISAPCSSTGPPILSFSDYFALILLTQAPMASRLPDPSTSNLYLVSDIAQTNEWVNSICHSFEKLLLFRGPNGDHWDEGKYIFRAKV